MILKVFKYKKVKSTNDIAITKIKYGLDSGIVVSSEQTKGRGQYGKKWISKKGNLFISIFYKIRKNSQLSKLIKTNLNILKNVISNYTKQKINIKKPNDIMVNKKKLCGVLHETIIYNRYKYLIMGIGINIINSPKFKEYPTTFMNKISKKKINNEHLFSILKFKFESKLNEYSR